MYSYDFPPENELTVFFALFVNFLAYCYTEAQPQLDGASRQGNGNGAG